MRIVCQKHNWEHSYNLCPYCINGFTTSKEFNLDEFNKLREEKKFLIGTLIKILACDDNKAVNLARFALEQM